MRKYLATFAVIAAAAGLVAAPIEAGRLSGEERLAKLIGDRSAGEPRKCIVTNSSQSLTIIDRTAIVYRQGGKVWVNRTAHPQDLDEDDIMVIRRYGSSLCRTDMITQVDRLSGMFSGAIFLTDFVPYEKAG
jgi:hypothetical protein